MCDNEHAYVFVDNHDNQRGHGGGGNILVCSPISQGPLNIWTEHSNCQIHNRGDSKTLIALLIPNIFLIFFFEIIFRCI